MTLLEATLSGQLFLTCLCRHVTYLDPQSWDGNKIFLLLLAFSVIRDIIIPPSVELLRGRGAGVQNMEESHIKSIEICAPTVSEEEKKKWAEKHARCLQHLFEQWQKPLGIDGEKYREHLRQELADYCDEPLLKSFIESIA